MKVIDMGWYYNKIKQFPRTLLYPSLVILTIMSIWVFTTLLNQGQLLLTSREYLIFLLSPIYLLWVFLTGIFGILYDSNLFTKHHLLPNLVQIQESKSKLMINDSGLINLIVIISALFFVYIFVGVS